MSEYWWRQFADQRRLDPAGCRDLQRRLEQARARLAAAVRALEQQPGQLHETRWRLERLRCAGWPPGGRPPREWPGWCREVRDRIARLEAAIAELAKREAAARDEVISLDLAHEQGCLMERRLREAW